jgi:LPXTG-motif cell wall-anchored protein
MIVKKVLLFLICSILIHMSFILYPINLAHATTSSGKEIDINTSPEKALFNVSKLVPGDRATRTITIKNSGNQDFHYLSSVKLISGSEKLYNELLLIILDKNSELYKGKLSDFNKIEPRLLSSNSKEDLTFIIEFPSSLGNEFQGLESKFEFKFYVEGTLGGVLPADGPKLPNTGSDMFNILVAGSVLVLTGSMLQFIVKRRSKLRKEV